MHAVAVIFFIGLVAQEQSKAKSFSFGYAFEAFDAAQTPFAAKHLTLKREQSLELRRLNLQLRQSGPMRAIRNQLGEIRRSNAEVKELYDTYKKETPLVYEFNRRVLARIDEVIDDAEKSQQFRRVAMVVLLQLGSVEAVLRLNEFELDLKQFAELIEKRIALQTNKMSPNEFRHVSSLRSVRDVLSDDEITKATGEKYAGTFPGQDGAAGFDPVHQYYQDSPLTLIMNPKFQSELGMSVGQVSILNNRRSELKTKFDKQSVGGIAVGGSRPADIIDTLTKKRKELDREIAALLTAQQQVRLNQLLFQFHVRRLDHRWAMKYAGKKFEAKPADPLRLNKIRYEARYLAKAASIRDHMQILVDIVGLKRARRMCGGELILPNTTTKTNEANEEIRLRVEREYLRGFLQRPKNPRRSD